MTDKKKPPMAAAIRTFVAGMKFPPAKHGPNPNTNLAMFVVVMLQFAQGVTEGCTTVTVSPSVLQISEVMHGSDSTVKRYLKALRELGLVTSRERGHFSTEYTFHQIPARSTVDLAAAGSTVGTARKRQRGQLPSPARSTSAPARSTPLPARSTVDPLWGKASGSSLEKTSLEKEAVESDVGYFSDKSVQTVDGDSAQGVSRGIKGLPAGAVIRRVL